MYTMNGKEQWKFLRRKAKAAVCTQIHCAFSKRTARAMYGLLGVCLVHTVKRMLKLVNLK